MAEYLYDYYLGDGYANYGWSRDPDLAEHLAKQYWVDCVAEETGSELDEIKSKLRNELVKAAENGHMLVINAIIGTARNLVSGKFMKTRLPALVRAVINGHTQCVKALLDDFYNSCTRDNLADEDHSQVGSCLIVYAAEFQQSDCVEALLAHGVEVNKVWGKRTALCMASRSGSVECVRLLLEAGADPNLTAANGDMAPLSQARKLECAKLLVEHGAKVNAVNSVGATALSTKTQFRQVDTCRYLLEQGARMDLYSANRGPPLVDAVRYEAFNLITLFLNHGAGIEEADAKGYTPLIMAVKLKKLKMVRFLLEKGANPETKDLTGQTALHHLASMRWSSNFTIQLTASMFVRLLVENNADPDAIDNSGKTPLSNAIDSRLDVVVEVLFECGATNTGNIKGPKSVQQLARDSLCKVGQVLRAHFRKTRRRKFRGIVRFMIVARRYREDFYSDKYVAIGAKSFARKRKEREEDNIYAFGVLKIELD